jgi:4-diphosphocytidyl-2-C-methyl-D-erythritol kinase
MAGVTVIAPAKVNLTLHVTGQRPDGYHEIETVAVFAGIGDRIDARAAQHDAFAIDGPFGTGLAADGENLAVRARDALRKAAIAAGLPAPGVALHLAKNLPVSSGIGGGSADAAATLIALMHLWRLPQSQAVAELAVRLGADVPMCLHSKPLHASGVGETIRPLRISAPFHAVLVNPGVAVATRAVFAGLQKRDNAPMEPLPQQGISAEWLAAQRNDLQEPAVRAFPVISEVLDEIGRCNGLMLARMSGSGATCFGLFETVDAAGEAAAAISRTHPGWWCVATSLLPEEYPGRIRQDED